MLLELEKLKQNYKKLIGVFPFPISPLKFHILLVKDSKKIIFELCKESVEEDWCLYSKEKLLNEHFDDEGLFQFKNKEAFKVLKKLTEVIEVNELEANKDEDILDIEDVINEHQVYLKAMENFNKAKEDDEEDVNRLVELEKRHKNKNLYLLETLCDKGQE